MDITKRLTDEQNWYTSFKSVPLTKKYEREGSNELAVTFYFKLEKNGEDLKRLTASCSLSRFMQEICINRKWEYMELFYNERDNKLAFKFTTDRKSGNARKLNLKSRRITFSCSGMIPILKKYFGKENLVDMGPQKLVHPKVYEYVFIFQRGM